MKKFVVLLLIPVLVLALVACEPGEATEDVPADTEVPEDDELFEDEPADDEFTEDEGLTDDDEMLDAEAVNDALVSSVLGTRLWLRDTDEADNVETVRIEDILFDQDGTIEYIVIDTGGLFDDTRRSVAVEPDIIGFTSPEGDRQITYLAEYPDLETAPEFDVAGAGEGPTVADDVEAEFAGLLRANIYQDFVVRNNADEGVGNVENLIADFETNEITHAIVEVGGFLDIGDTEVVVPWDSFTWDAENETFILPVSRDVIENAPVFDDTEWTNGAPGADWDAEHTAYWDDVEYEDVGAMDDDDAMANGDVTAVARASELLGTRFRLPDADATFNVDTVQVEDILFSADGAIQYVVIDTGGIFDFDSGVVAVGQERIEFTTVEGERLLTYIPTYTELDTELAFDLTAIGPGVAIDEDNPAMAEFASLLRASQYQDFVVNNEEGDNIGNADDLLIDINQAQVIYSIVDVGGFLGINENEIAVPWSMFTWDPEQDMFILPVEQTVLEAAPVFDDDEWAEGPPAAGWDDEYATYWDDLDTE